jgi:hypothetical protein
VHCHRELSSSKARRSSHSFGSGLPRAQTPSQRQKKNEHAIRYQKEYNVKTHTKGAADDRTNPPLPERKTTTQESTEPTTDRPSFRQRRPVPTLRLHAGRIRSGRHKRTKIETTKINPGTHMIRSGDFFILQDTYAPYFFQCRKRKSDATLTNTIATGTYGQYSRQVSNRYQTTSATSALASCIGIPHF